MADSVDVILKVLCSVAVAVLFPLSLLHQSSGAEKRLKKMEEENARLNSGKVAS